MLKKTRRRTLSYVGTDLEKDNKESPFLPKDRCRKRQEQKPFPM